MLEKRLQMSDYTTQSHFEFLIMTPCRLAQTFLPLKTTLPSFSLPHTDVVAFSTPGIKWGKGRRKLRFRGIRSKKKVESREEENGRRGGEKEGGERDDFK